ncbi:MAG: hypothetical protein KF892_09055 [Rhizobacter sp.]|nr:hypothetical protein [Rhizobacter sp.]
MIQKMALCACTVAAAWAMPAQAAEVGLGVAVYQNSGTVFVPIDVGPSLRIEPYFTNGTQRRSNSTTEYSRSVYTTLGVGAVGLWPVADNTRLLAGGRLGYHRMRSHYEYPGSTPQDTSAAGPVLAPLIGFEYWVNKKLAVGVEASYYYARVKGHAEDFLARRVDTKQTDTGTSTAVTLRFFF